MARPLVYKGRLAYYIARLSGRVSALQAMKILNARVGTTLAGKRSAKLVPTPLGITMPTILKIAHRYNVELPMGRRPQAA
jgi:hypothetical protein